jgi:hypothetical protein
MVAFTTNGGSVGNSCDTETAVDNVAPEVNAGADYTIPKETPFLLTATGTDADGDTLTYTWEEYDLGAASAAGSNTDNDNSGQARPIFRSYKGTTDPTRTFPSLKYILNYANNPPAIYDCGRTTTPIGGEPVSDPCITGEDMPSIERTMKFQVTARDYRAVGGGIDSDLMQVSVKDSAGPFVITAPNTAVTWDGGSTQTVTWNVANTDAAPISCANVRIQVSTDGGNHFSTILESTPNDGSEAISVPATPTTTARIKVQAVGNIFFDISNANFTITGSSPSAYHAPYDFDGDGNSDLSHFRGSEGLWDIVASGDTGGSHVQRFWGLSSLGDQIVPADYDGDGKADYAVYRNGTWYVSRNTGGDMTFAWGAPTDIPVPADYDNDGKADIAVWRPAEGVLQGLWYVLKSSTNYTAYDVAQFGSSTDKPLAGDYNGDGKADYAVVRRSSGLMTWYILYNGGSTFAASGWGLDTDVAVHADFDGDRKNDLAVWRASNGTWYALKSGGGGIIGSQWGQAGDIPVAADYDGDGKTDLGVYRPGETTWYTNGSTSGVAINSFGTAGDAPIPSAYNR